MPNKWFKYVPAVGLHRTRLSARRLTRRWASRQDNVQPALPCLRPHLSVHDVAGQFVFDAHLSSDGWDSLILLEVALENFMGLIERHAFLAHPPNNSYMDSPTNQV